MDKDVKLSTGYSAVLLTALLIAFLTGCSGESPDQSGSEEAEVARPVTESAGNLRDVAEALLVLGEAPEIANETWLNVDGTTTLSAQRGKVVLIEFWTFGCINCRRVIPYINDWYAAYQGDDFEILSVHYPEFAYEREIENVRAAIERYEIEYPVAIDNDRETWGAYQQRYWPTRYLVDRQGNIRYKHIGEGAYEETARYIEALLAEKP